MKTFLYEHNGDVAVFECENETKLKEYLELWSYPLGGKISEIKITKIV